MTARSTQQETAPIPTLEDARALLRRHFGYEDFRGGQHDAIRAVVEGRDVLVLMPTGGGKSLCYQIPSQLLPGLTIVVSPLISLMKDQVDAMDDVGLPATFINSTLSADETLHRLERLRRGDVKLLYVAPERFANARFRERLSELQVSLLAIDEAHCISQWGHDFRPSYLRLGEVRAALGCPTMALTATATREVRHDVLRQLRLVDPAVVVRGFDRTNLAWHVLAARNDAEKERLLLRLVRERAADGVVIVYASTRKKVDAVAELLDVHGVPAAGYHAGVADADRKRLQDDFMEERIRVVAATNAFGMGIDKPNVRLVVHFDMPGSVEAYFQEAGRAGRDGRPAACVLLHSYPDRFTHEFFIEQNLPDRDVVEAVHGALARRADGDGVADVDPEVLAKRLTPVRGERQLHAALRILEDAGVLRRIAAAAGPAWVRLLADPARIRKELDVPGREDELRLLRALWRHASGSALARGLELDRRTIAELASGAHTAASAGELFDRLRQDGVLDVRAWPGREGVQLLRAGPDAMDAVDWRTLDAKRRRDLRRLQRMQAYAYTDRCRRGFLLRYFGDPDAMHRCHDCDNCNGEEGAIVAGARPPHRRGAESGRAPGPVDRAAARAGTPASAAAARPAYSKTASSRAPAPARPLGPADERLLARLKALRSDLARAARLPAYCIFNDRTLVALVRHRPATPDELLRIPGIGPAKLDKYGARFLAALDAAAGTRDPEDPS